ncbi:MAG: hypothetical protein Q9162_006865 [Coniocarpon cinnabarinum]
MAEKISSRVLVEQIQQLLVLQDLGQVGVHELLVEKIDRLKFAVQTPWETLWETRFRMLDPICKRIAMEMGVFDVISRAGGAPTSVDDIAKETEQEKEVIGKRKSDLPLSRPLNSRAERHSEDNAVTELLVSEEGVAAEKYFYDFLFPIGANVIDCMHVHGLKPCSSDDGKTPFEYTFGSRIFEYLQKPNGAEAKQNFDALMRGRRHGAPIQWFETFPASTLLINDISCKPVNGESKTREDDVILVDVAGGQGHDILAFAKTIDHMEGQLVLQDLDITLSQIKADQKRLLQGKGIQLQPYDFFTPQPIQGAHFYFFRDICHDWHDEEARAILQQTARAMTPWYSRMLIEDHVVDVQNAHHRPAASDMLMMLVLSGRERTLPEWQDLISSVGLEIVKVWPSKRGHQSVIEVWKNAVE